MRAPFTHLWVAAIAIVVSTSVGAQRELYVFTGEGPGDRFGSAVAGAGDVDGDGRADVIVGALQDDNNGSNSGSIRVLSGLDGSVLFSIDGAAADDQLGFAVAGAGDVNGDGHADLAVGTFRGARLLFGRGGGAFTVDARAFGDGVVEGLVLADLDADGDIDFATIEEMRTVRVWRQRAGGVARRYGAGKAASDPYSSPSNSVLDKNPPPPNPIIANSYVGTTGQGGANV